ncbi:MAG: protein kinase domain-containing protein [Fimbriiglobus sp.]
MDRVAPFLCAVGQAIAGKGRRAILGEIGYGDVLLDVAKAALDEARRTLPSDDLKYAIAATATAAPEVFADVLERALERIGRGPRSLYRAEVEAYLGCLPVSIRQVLRRPSDPAGTTAPPKLTFYKPDDLLMFLPPRCPRFHPAGEPDGLDGWELAELAGFGECSEVWAGTDDARPDESPAALKFAVDKATAAAVVARPEVFHKTFELTDVPGVVPLRSVYLDSDPPCLESLFVPGYDLTSVIHDWKWRYESAKPEAAEKLVRRIAEVVAEAHVRGFVHRDLKPSNVLLYPTDGGRFTLWVTDFGWGQVQAERSVELGKYGTPRAEQVRLGRRGAYTPLYAAPQVAKLAAPDPRDDVHAIGVIWYQLICRDPNEGAPSGLDWAGPHYAAGLTDAQARLLTACVSPNPDKRPANAMVLAEQLAALPAAPRPATHTDGSRLLPVKGHATTDKVPPGAGNSGAVRRPTAR